MENRTCSIPDCEKKLAARGLCQMHYLRLKRHGDVNTVKRAKRACAVEGCDRTHYGHGLCQTHFRRKERSGEVRPGVPITLNTEDPEESFTERTKWRGECLIWIASTANGYGRMSIDGEKNRSAHRYAWERVNGPVPDGMYIDHICWNKACVNVEHLRLASPSQNTSYQQEVRNATGVKCVQYRAGKYYVSVTKDGESHYGGAFETLEEATEASRNLRQRLHGEFAGNHVATVRAVQSAIEGATK